MMKKINLNVKPKEYKNRNLKVKKFQKQYIKKPQLK